MMDYQTILFTAYCQTKPKKYGAALTKIFLDLMLQLGRLLHLKKQMAYRAMNLIGCINLFVTIDAWLLVAWMGLLFLTPLILTAWLNHGMCPCFSQACKLITRYRITIKVTVF